MSLPSTDVQDMREPWERQQGESAAEFRKFTAYRDMQGRRSIVNSGGSSELARRWNWLDRVAAWEDHLDAIARGERREQVAKQAARFGYMSQRLWAQVDNHLSWVGERCERYRAMEKEGEIPEREGIFWPISNRDMAMFAELAARFDARSLGTPEEIEDHDNDFRTILTDPRVQEAAREFTRAAAEARERELEQQGVS